MMEFVPGSITEEDLKRAEVEKTSSIESSPLSPTKLYKEVELESNDVDERNWLGGGCNKAYQLSLKDDGEVVFKPKGGEKSKLRQGIPVGTYYQRERAAYVVDRFLGFGLVPTTVIRKATLEDGSEDWGSAQEFIPETKSAGECNYKEEIKAIKDLVRLYIFDYIIHNADRHCGNLLIKDDKVFAIDNGLSFGRCDKKLYDTVSKIFSQKVPQDLKEQLISLCGSRDWSESFRVALSDCLPEDEITACVNRIKYMVSILQHTKVVPDVYGWSFEGR